MDFLLNSNIVPICFAVLHTIAIASAITSAIIWKLMQQPGKKEPLIKIKTIKTIKECVEMCEILTEDVKKHAVLGIDAEWVQRGKTRQPVALLQLCTTSRNCGLFRLNNLKSVPDCLKKILVDEKIVKVGIVPENDVHLICQDYGVLAKSTLDLRYLYRTCFGLAKLAHEYLNIKLDKSYHVRCSNWESEELSDQQKNYAAMDVYVAIELYKKWAGLTGYRKFLPKFHYFDVSICLDLKYRTKNTENTAVQNERRPKVNAKAIDHFGVIDSNKVIYDNTLLKAPDGTLLSTIKQKKALWYVNMGLAEVESEDPYTIKLKFEPKKKPKHNEYLYEKELKKDQCVVCGSTKKLLKHYVVPRMFIKLFPEAMRSHCSHDIVLFCVSCHMKSSYSNGLLMKQLESQAGWKVEDGQDTEAELTKKSSLNHLATALLYRKATIPEKRLQEIHEIIQKTLNIDEVTDEVLADILESEKVRKKLTSRNASTKIVELYTQDGRSLHDLQKLWRRHFMDNMKPKFLPTNWSVNHSNI